MFQLTQLSVPYLVKSKGNNLESTFRGGGIYFHVLVLGAVVNVSSVTGIRAVFARDYLKLTFNGYRSFRGSCFTAWLRQQSTCSRVAQHWVR